MILLLGILAWLAGATLFTLSIRQLGETNPTERISAFFGSPSHTPRRAYLLRAAGMMLLGASALIWTEALGYWAIGLIAVGAIPALLIHARHNRLAAAH